ncbi:MAG: cyclic nucleotide-binding domain-containing protein [Treponema sp.]|jgi:CRP-like cAMP-binding protein|nr:cyclic nucleotide-binding domain-containing protein [Treponema sp.]
MDSFEQVLPKLVKIQLFSGFDISNPDDKRILKAVYDNLSVQKFKAGKTIIKEGEVGDSFYILYEGQVLITRGTPAGDVIALATLSSELNIFFGETSIISNDERTATVTAKTDCTTLTISGKKFLEICDSEPILGYRVLAVLARRLANTIRETNKDKAILYEALCNEIEIGV